jgi:hypothetical protein
MAAADEGKEKSQPQPVEGDEGDGGQPYAVDVAAEKDIFDEVFK